jgi:hypothetical protein
MFSSRTTDAATVAANSNASIHGTRSSGARAPPGKITNTKGSITSTSA